MWTIVSRQGLWLEHTCHCSSGLLHREGILCLKSWPDDSCKQRELRSTGIKETQRSLNPSIHLVLHCFLQLFSNDRWVLLTQGLEWQLSNDSVHATCSPPVKLLLKVTQFGDCRSNNKVQHVRHQSVLGKANVLFALLPTHSGVGVI